MPAMVHIDVARPASAPPVAGAVLLHPHPDFGGDRHNIVIDALFGRLPGAGCTTVRFDFSSSAPDAAAADAREALGHLDADLPRFVVGYSFGADIATGLDDREVAGWALIAPPLRFSTATAPGPQGPRTPPVGADPRPKLVLAAAHDQFSAPAMIEAATAGWQSTTREVIEGADHFLGGRAGWVADRVANWVTEAARPAAR